MAATPGKKEIKVELKFYPMKEMSPKAREFVGKDPEMKKKFEAAVEWSEKGEFDPRKHNKKSLDEEMWYAARMPFKIFANRVDKAAKDGGDAKKVKKELFSDYEEAVKGAVSNCSLKFEDIQSGKEDNKKALKDGKAAFAKIDSVDFKGAFDKPRTEVVDALVELGIALKAKTGNSAKSFEKARKVVEKWVGEYDKVGKEATAVIDFLLKTGRALKNDSKADVTLVNFGAAIMKSESTFDEFVKQSDAFSKALDQAQAMLKANTAEAAEVNNLAKEMAKMSALEASAQEVLSAAKDLKKEFKDVEKNLK